MEAWRGGYTGSVETRKAVALFFLFSAEIAAAEFVIRVTPAARRGELQVRYFLSGEFGGLSGFETRAVDADGVAIPGESQGKPVKSLRAVLFLPGCEMDTVRAGDLSSGPREARFLCRPLATTRLQGRAGRSLPEPGRRATVAVYYLAHWTHAFFGITDGAVPMFDLGSAPLAADGGFEVTVPDFAADAISSGVGRDAALWVRLRDAETWNPVAEPVMLPVARKYPFLDEFEAARQYPDPRRR